MDLSACLHDDRTSAWLAFEAPESVIAAYTLADVVPALQEIQRRVDREGSWAVGAIAYEAAPAFDSAMVAHPPVHGLPLVWFGLHSGPNTLDRLPSEPVLEPNGPAPELTWRPDFTPEEYDQAIRQVKSQIAAGNTYQVNYTLRMRAHFEQDPWSYFGRLVRAQRGNFSAFIRTDRHVICSASPELFFSLEGDKLTSMPMKGTAARGRTPEEDHQQSVWLQQSEKNRAENVMIVDMVRNDMGRIARTGSVVVRSLFDVERYPHLLQMTSTVECRTPAAFPDILGALFPCASITGAPKIRTMEIIRELESAPRGMYTGAVGWLAPGRRASFNVAIRTMVLDTHTRQAEYGTGSGIVWDSDTSGEYDESLLKASILTAPRPPFSLLESLLWSPEGGFFLLERHLQRMAASADYFGYPLPIDAIRQGLEWAVLVLARKPHKVRLLVDENGAFKVETRPLPAGFRFVDHPDQSRAASWALCPHAIDSQDAFLFHKTTRRSQYDLAQQARPDVEHVLLWNLEGQVTETNLANLVFLIDGRCYTPPVACGLLAGTYRAELLDSGLVSERVLMKSELEALEGLWAVNAVRGWQRLESPH